MPVPSVEFQFLKAIFLASAIACAVYHHAAGIKRLAAMKPPRLPPSVPQTPEQIQQRIDEIRSLAATRFQVSEESLTEAVRLNQDLRIPRSELFDFIDDLEERFPLQGSPGDTSKIATFGDLTARFIPAAPNDR